MIAPHQFKHVLTAKVIFAVGIVIQAMEEDLEMRHNALESVKNAAEELLRQAGDEQDEAVKGKKNVGFKPS